MQFFKKYRLQFEILAVLAFGFGSWMQFDDYANPEGKKINLISGIVFGLLAIMRLVDLVDELRKKRKEKIKNL